MALNKLTNTPAFEEDETLVDQVEVLEKEEAPVDAEPVAAAEPVKETAVAPVVPKGLAKVGPKFGAAYQEFQNQIPIETVIELGVGTIPKLVADRGGFEIDKVSYGDSIQVELISYNNRWLLTTGVDDEASKEKLRNSYDNKEIVGETMSVNEYIDLLKSEGYSKASSKQYIDMFGIILTKDGKEIPEEERGLTHIQLSPSSVKKWKSFQLQQGIKAAKYNLDSKDVITLTIEKLEYNGNKFAAISFSA